VKLSIVGNKMSSGSLEKSHLDDLDKVRQKHSLQMMEDLEKAYADKRFLDVTVTCGDASFKCNKFMLTARSPVFKAMFQHDNKESQSNVVEIKDIESKVLEEILHYIHTGDAPNIKNLAKDLLAAADFYQLDQLKTRCQELLSESLDPENAIEMLYLSEKFSAQKLRIEALKFVANNSNSVNWKDLEEDHPLNQEIIDSLLTKIAEKVEILMEKENELSVLTKKMEKQDEILMELHGERK